jgi:protoporphyrinogen oxidase
MIRRVTILGAGVCGLATAIRLLTRDHGLEVTLLESGDRVGGLARSLTIGDQVTDLGPHRIHTVLPDVQDFLEDIAGKELQRVERKSRMWLQGQWIEYPPKPLEIARVLGPATMARCMTGFAAAKLRTPPPREKQSFETVMTGAFGDQLYRLIVMGYTRKVWKTDPRRIHADIARVRVSAGGLDRMLKRVVGLEKEGQETALRRFYYLPGGVATLVEKMRERAVTLGAQINTESTVTGLKRVRTGHWRVQYNGPRGGHRTTTADAVISTLPVHDLAAMLQHVAPDERAQQAAGGLRCLANFLVCIHINKRRVTDSQWLYFPGEDTLFNRGCEPKNFHASMGDDKTTLLVMEVTCLPGDAIWNASDDELVRQTINGLVKTKLIQPRDVLGTLVHRIPNVYPLYDLQYRQRITTVLKWLATFPGLVSTGRQGLFLHNNMDHSIHMGFRAAESILDQKPENIGRSHYQHLRRFQQFKIVD